MELFVNIDVTWKLLTISAKSSISNNWLGSKYTSGIWKVTLHKCTRNGKHLLKNEKHAKIGLVKQLEQLLWNVPKKAVLRFLGKHAWRRPLLSRCTGSSLERYYRKPSSNILSSDLFEITRNFCSTRRTTAISFPLSYHVYCVVTPPRQYK